MWYSKVVESGLIDMMKDPIKESEDIITDLDRLNYRSIASLPEVGSIKNYFLKLLNKIGKLKENEIKKIINTLQYLILQYSNDPKEVDNARAFTNILGKFARVIRGENPKIVLDPEITKNIGIHGFISIQNDPVYAGTISDNMQNHDYIYNTSYSEMINHWDSGLIFGFPIMMTIVSGQDKKSSENLKNARDREVLKARIIEKFPIFENFDTEIHSKDDIVNFIIESLKNWRTSALEKDITRSFFNIGISKDDMMYILKKMIDNNLYISPREKMLGLLLPDRLDLLDYVINNKPDYTNKGYLFDLLYFPNYPDTYSTTYFELNLYKQRIANIVAFYKEEILKSSSQLYYLKNLEEVRLLSIQLKYLIFSGVFGEENKLDLYSFLKAEEEIKIVTTIFQFNEEELKKVEERKENREKEREKRIQEFEKQRKLDEAENLKKQKELELEKEEKEKKRKLEFNPGSKYFIKFLESGDIEKRFMSDPALQEDLRALAKSFWYSDKETSKDQEILNFLSLNIPVYFVKNTNFYDSLDPMENFSGLTIASQKPLGFFQYEFSENLIPENTTSAIFLNEFHYEDMMNEETYLKNLGITKNTLSRLTFVHEVAHLLHYVKMGGLYGGWRLLSLEPKMVENKSRVYLTDMKEIVARAFGNISLMQSIIHNQVQELSRSEHFQKACLEEMVEHMLEQPYLNLEPAFNEFTGKTLSLMTVDEISKWAGARRGPFQYGNASEAAEKKIERQKRFLRNYFQAQGNSIKKETSLKLLKEINQTKRLIDAAKAQVEEEVSISSDNLKKLNELLSMKKQLEDDLLILQQKLRDVRSGALNVEYDLAIEILSSYMALRDVTITNKIVSDPAYNPPNSIFKTEGEGNKVFTEDSTPLTREELKEIRDYDLEITDEWGRRNTRSGPIALDAISFDDYEMYFPMIVQGSGIQPEKLSDEEKTKLLIKVIPDVLDKYFKITGIKIDPNTLTPQGFKVIMDSIGYVLEYDEGEKFTEQKTSFNSRKLRLA